MNAAATEGRVVLQPETRDEQTHTYALFSLFEPPTCWFTLDLEQYDGLDHDLARRRSEAGEWLPGSRALVIVTDSMNDE